MNRAGYRLRATGCALAALTALAGCASSAGHDGPGHTRAGHELVGTARHIEGDQAAAVRLARTEQAFSLALLAKIGDGSKNVSASPESLAVALSMLANGASGETKTQLDEALRTTGLTTQQVDAGWLALLDAWKQEGKITFSSANATWVQKGLPVRPEFLNTLATYYGAGVWQADFTRHMDDALSAINSWTRKNTRGKITKLFDELDPATLLVLANAVYFKAAWAHPFDPSDTSDGAFTRGSGDQVDTPFLTDPTGSYPAAVGADYEAVQLPYDGGRFAALAVMPKSGTLSDFAQHLDVAGLDQIVNSLEDQPVDVALPKFTTTSTLDLQAALKALGMPIAFTDAADFSRLTDQSVQIGQVVQRVYLSVAEKGTEAAAVTGVGIAGSGAIATPPLRIRFDHPFLFLIRDTRTGAILFASQIQDPTAS